METDDFVTATVSDGRAAARAVLPGRHTVEKRTPRAISAYRMPAVSRDPGLSRYAIRRILSSFAVTHARVAAEAHPWIDLRAQAPCLSPIHRVSRLGAASVHDANQRWARKRAKSGGRFSAKARTPSCASGERANSCRPLKASAPCAARCSVSLLKDCLRKRRAVGERARISSA